MSFLFSNSGLYAQIALVMPAGHTQTIAGILFALVIGYLGIRERYLFTWLAGWAMFLLSRWLLLPSVALRAERLNPHLSPLSALLACLLFAVAALQFTRSRKWVLVLLGVAAPGALALLLTGIWPAADPSLTVIFQACFHALAVLGAVPLIRYGLGSRTAGPWVFAVTLLILNPVNSGDPGPWGISFDFIAAAMLRASILLIVLEESRSRSRRLEAMKAITVVTAGANDSGSMMEAAMGELARLMGAGFAWFQTLQGEELILHNQIGLPESLVARHGRVHVRGSLVVPWITNLETKAIPVRTLPAELRDDLEAAGMRSLVLIPVMGKTNLVGVLGFGQRGLRSFTADELQFLTATVNQLGIAAENLQMLAQVLHTQRQWLTTIDSIDDYILVHDSGPRILRLNRALARRLGRSVAELTGEHLADALPNAEMGCPYCRLERRAGTEVSDPCFGGYSLVSTSSFVEDRGGTMGTVHIICDRTERRTGEERYRKLFESVQEGVFVTTPDGRLLDCNPAFAAMIGSGGRDEILGTEMVTLFATPAEQVAHARAMDEQGSLHNYELTLRRRDGQLINVLESSFAARDSLGKIERYQGFLLDVTEKKRAEEDMKRRNRELGALNAMATIATRTFDLDEILQNTLQSSVSLFGQHCDILMMDTTNGSVMRSETSRQNRDAEREALRGLLDEDLTEYIEETRCELFTERQLEHLPAGVVRWLESHSLQSFLAVVMYSQQKIGGLFIVSSPEKHQFAETDQNLAIAIARQLGNTVEKVLLYEETARAYEHLRNAQEQLLQSEKMSAIGRLVSGVAHELNNPLTAILGYAQLLETEPISERAQDFVRKLYQQTQRTHRVVQNLLSFSRQRRPLQSQVDLQRALEDTLTLRESDLKLNNVIVERAYEASVPFITGDAQQLEQVFVNIINNAVDAIMDSAQSGRLQVRLYAQGNWACVEFRDSGPGLQDPKRIFDPFYTTKKLGKGTGLGLSICYGIVKEHGGDIVAFNHEQGGAVFQIKLPVAARERYSQLVGASRRPSQG